MGKKQSYPKVDADKEIGKAKKTAEDYAADKEKTEHLVNEAFAKAERYKGRLEKIWDDLMALFRLVAAWAKGQYREVPLRTVVLAIAAIVYFVNPFDFIPDFIPGVGYIDDATVVSFVLMSIRGDVQDFTEWERSEMTS